MLLCVPGTSEHVNSVPDRALLYGESTAPHVRVSNATLASLFGRAVLEGAQKSVEEHGEKAELLLFRIAELECSLSARRCGRLRMTAIKRQACTIG